MGGLESRDLNVKYKNDGQQPVIRMQNPQVDLLFGLAKGSECVASLVV